MSPNIYNTSYSHAAGGDHSAARGARYISRRPHQGQEPTRESEWREIEHIGDRNGFIAEANRRRDVKRGKAKEQGKDLSKDKSPGSSQYLHVVISPENSERMSDRDFQEIAKEWTRDEVGREYPHVGAVHRDSAERGGESHDHLHLLIARDKFSKEELTQRKEASEELVRFIERYKGLDREPEREPGRDREPHGSARRELGEEHDRGEKEQGRVVQGREVER